jgi:nucleoside-diphosphate-sugar epimerase
MNTAIITGATGFIGGALCQKLLKDGVKVYGVGRDRARLDGLSQYGDFKAISLDFSEYAALPSLIPERGADIFFHLAWLAGDQLSRDYEIQIANIAGACKAVQSANQLGVKKFLMAGSYYQFKTRKAPVGNRRTLDNVFGIAKTCALELCRNMADEMNLPYVSVYIPKIFGCGDRASSAPVKIIQQLLTDAPIKLITGEDLDDWVYIDDLVDGILAAVEGRRGEYYIGHRNLQAFRDIITEIKTGLHSKSPLLFGEYADNSFIDYTKLDVNALYSDTGFECKADFADAIQKLAKWIKTLYTGG